MRTKISSKPAVPSNHLVAPHHWPNMWTRARTFERVVFADFWRSESRAARRRITSSDGHSFFATTPLIDGARYYLEKGVSPEASIVTICSSHWTLRPTIGQAAKLTVKSDKLGKPIFRPDTCP